jgi:hypothetical protein
MQGDGREHRNDAERIYSEESSDVEILYQFQSSKAAAVHRPHQDKGGMHKEEKNAEDSYVGSAEPNDSSQRDLRDRSFGFAAIQIKWNNHFETEPPTCQRASQNAE